MFTKRILHHFAMSTIIQLQIQLPLEKDMDYSDDVYWEKWEMRQLYIDSETYNNVPESEWSTVWYDLNDIDFEDEDEDDE